MVKGVLSANPVDQWKAAQPRGFSVSGARAIENGRALDSQEREDFLAATAEVAPKYFSFVLFLAETGCRIGEAIQLKWSDVDCDAGVARLFRPKTRRSTGDRADEIELSRRLVSVLEPRKPDIHPRDALAFTTPNSHAIRYENFRRRVWNPVVRRAFEGDRRVTPHSLRHTWATLHLARGTPIEWVREMGGWSSAKMLLDVYGHFLPREMRGFSDALAPRDRSRPHQAVGDA